MENTKDIVSSMTTLDLVKTVSDHLKEQLFNRYMRFICTAVANYNDTDYENHKLAIDINPVRDCEELEGSYTLEGRKVNIDDFSMLYLDVLNTVLKRSTGTYGMFAVSIRYKETITINSVASPKPISYPIFTIFLRHRAYSHEEG